jgi:hypothetical protein
MSTEIHISIPYRSGVLPSMRKASGWRAVIMTPPAAKFSEKFSSTLDRLLEEKLSLKKDGQDAPIF